MTFNPQLNESQLFRRTTEVNLVYVISSNVHGLRRGFYVVIPGTVI